MSALQQALESGRFAVTAELAPPKGFDMTAQLASAKALRGAVHAVNVTEMQGACLRASSIALCAHLKKAGLEPIFQSTGRDRSRMAILGDLLAAASFGIDTMLAVTGDHPMIGDCRVSKPVYDLDSVGILRMVSTMEATGLDCGGNALSSTPRFYKGAVATPAYEPLALQLHKLRQKVDAGASFIQTQALFEPDSLRRFMDAVDRAGIRAEVLLGVIPLKSAGMAKYMNDHIPGIRVPQDIIDRLAAAQEEGVVRGIKGLPARLGIQMAAELVARAQDDRLCDGVHIMAVSSESVVLEILGLAGVKI